MVLGIITLEQDVILIFYCYLGKHNYSSLLFALLGNITGSDSCMNISEEKKKLVRRLFRSSFVRYMRFLYLALYCS